jgi:hypothetical protein
MGNLGDGAGNLYIFKDLVREKRQHTENESNNR